MLFFIVINFFFYGILFESIILNYFGISYLAWAGVEDLVLGTVRYGGVVLGISLLVWMAYSLLLGLFLGFSLLGRVILNLRGENLPFRTRLAIIAYSLVIFLFNILRLIFLPLPTTIRRKSEKFLSQRERFALGLRRLRPASGATTPPPGLPARTAWHYFSRFALLQQFGRHRFFALAMIMVLSSIGLLTVAANKAGNTLTCLQETAAPSAGGTLALPSGMTQYSDCPGLAASPAASGGHMANLFSVVPGLLDFPLVRVDGPSPAGWMIYLRTTSRYTLFFDPAGHKPVVLPGALALNLWPAEPAPPKDRSAPVLAPAPSSQSEPAVVDTPSPLQRLLQELANLKRPAPETPPAQVPAQAAPFGYDSYTEIQADQIKDRNIPVGCLATPPSLVSRFQKDSHILSSPVDQQALIDHATKLAARPDAAVLVFGFADPSGRRGYNSYLSLKRAEHIRKWLVKLGVDNSRIMTLGLGENRSRFLPERRTEIRLCS
ncbi:hypothetical protein GCM10007924_27080 [Sneathiella chinensis]|uniref:OmpA-like domain-containing protein n=1 Tax=Sneathiella chinensis TaxID=349750 RepID=A0ABQ5U5P2_9PROT|nr:hypothetical protein GCM10007924_27080 [Sneathiella chinensis]